MARYNEIAADIEQLNRDLNTALAAANAYVDPHLTSEGLIAKRADMAKKARDVAAAKLQELETAFESKVESAKEAAARVIPKAEGSTRDAWERVKMVLDAGISLPRVVAEATPDQLHALAEWGPTWLAAQSAASRATGLGSAEWQAPDAAQLQRSLQGRWAEVLGGTAAETIAEAMDADVVTAGIHHTITHLATKAAGGMTVDPITAALNSHYAQQSAMLGLTPADS